MQLPGQIYSLFHQPLKEYLVVEVAKLIRRYFEFIAPSLQILLTSGEQRTSRTAAAFDGKAAGGLVADEDLHVGPVQRAQPQVPRLREALQIGATPFAASRLQSGIC